MINIGALIFLFGLGLLILEKHVQRRRVRRLLRKMGLMALYPRPKTTKPNKEHKIYPYLLRNLPITQVNQVWSSDITYIPMPRGFMYLVAVMDWFSRYVLACACPTHWMAHSALTHCGRRSSGESPPYLTRTRLPIHSPCLYGYAARCRYSDQYGRPRSRL